LKAITLLNEKGGVGKTTLATHIAAGLAIRGAKVLLVDADAQGTATASLGLTPSPGLYDLLVRGANFKDVIRIITPEIYESPKVKARGVLMILPGNVETRLIPQAVDDVFLLRRRLHELSPGLDIIVFDTPPTPSLLHSSIYMGTDAILYPTELEAFSFDSLVSSLAHKETFSQVQTKMGWDGIRTLGIVPIKARLNTVEHSENLSMLKQNYGDLVWNPLPLRITWAEAAMQRRTVFSYAPDSSAAKEALQMVDGVLEGLGYGKRQA
jgi:chromosome partitioning protein